MNGDALPVLSPAEVAALLPPDLAEKPVSWLGEGTDHRVYRLGQARVLRFPNWSGGGEALRREAALLTALAPALPLPVPAVLGWGQPAPSCPEGFAVARWLDGRSGLGVALPAPDQVGRSLGHFLNALHRVPRSSIDLPTDHDPTGADWQEAAHEDLAAGGDLVDLAFWARVVDSPPPLDVALVPIHGDFAAEHVLLDVAGRPCGVLDWADAALGDPARDWAGLLHWAEPDLLAAALAVAPQPAALLRRAAWYATCRALGDLAYGVVEGKEAYIHAGQRALDHLARGSVQAVGKPIL
ncbi:phosphotransferase [Deinococcus sp. HMF7604]|uniref:phosphotransferase family protein n=1 Tax=Deinococcus betulae TaxID=2873312 RepID=UPI001CCFCED6|nr:phosphotransferase [Deinococcus betulae]